MEHGISLKKIPNREVDYTIRITIVQYEDFIRNRLDFDCIVGYGSGDPHEAHRTAFSDAASMILFNFAPLQ